MNFRKVKENTIESLFTTVSVKYIFTADNLPYRAVVVSNIDGNYQLYAVDFVSGFKRQITSSTNGEIFGSISADGEYVYVLDQADGSEHGHFIKEPFTGGKRVDITPDSKNYFAYFATGSNDGSLVAFRAAVDDKNKVFAAKEDSGSYTAQELYETKNSLSEAVCSKSGDLICVGEMEASADGERLVFLTPDKVSQAKRSSLFPEIKPLAFSQKDKNKLLTIGRKGEWQRPFFYNISADEFFEVSHENFCGDVWVLHWDETLDRLIISDVYEAKQKLYSYSMKTNKLQRIGPETGSFNYHFNSMAVNAAGEMVVRWSDFNTSPRLVAIDVSRPKKWSEVPEWSGSISTNYDVEEVVAQSSDKEDVQAWVIRPQDTQAPLPFIVDIHGGPHGVTLNEFSSKAHVWLKNGFGYCAVNYRGSTSFGKEFERDIYGDPGYFETEDVVAVHNLLIDNDYAAPEQIILHGWSWGGYVTLLALGKYPNLWKGGVAGAAITDCMKQYQDEPAYFQSKDRERFRGTPESNREQYVRSSPVTYAEDIAAPILLIHGKNDVRCPPRQIKDFEKILKESQKSVEIEWFDSGHVGEFSNTDLGIRMMKRAVQFVKRII